MSRIDKSNETEKTEVGDKVQMTLDQFISKAKKVYGKNVVIDIVNDKGYGDIIPFSSFSLNNALGVGGVAMNKITLFDGDPSSGKSTTAYDAIGHAQRLYKRPCLLIDKERGATNLYLKQLKIDVSPDMLVILSPHTLEDMYDIVARALINKLFACIVIDSVTSFAPSGRFLGQEQLGLESRINSDKMRIINDAVPDSNCALIGICQIRNKIGVIGDPVTISGGLAWPFYSHVRVRITRSKIERELQQNIMKFTVIKNKLAVPFKVGTVVYNWNEGFSASSEIAELSVEFGIIRNQGNSYFLDGAAEDNSELKLVGKKNVVAFLNDNIAYRDKFIKPLLEERLKETTLRSDEVNENDINN